MTERDETWGAATWLVAGGRPDAAGAPLNEPIVLASNFRSSGEAPYSRGDGTATWEAFEAVVGGLEHGEAVSFSSGMAAISAVFGLLAPDSTVVIPGDCYQGVAGVAKAGAAAGRWSLELLDTSDTDGWVEAAGRCDLVWVETPSNPLLVVGDLVAIGAVQRRDGALLVADNTFATPLNQRPLDLGADISVQSATKFIGGHSDLLSGVATTRSTELATRLRSHRQLHGATPGALESFLALRGIRTLALRLERSQAAAGEIARRLAHHVAVECVRYPGLPDHPGHDIACRQLAGFGSVLSFDVVGGGGPATVACGAVRLVRHATSLGGVESTMERRATIPGQEHLPAGLIRLAVGIEDVDDLWADLDRALVAATAR